MDALSRELFTPQGEGNQGSPMQKIQQKRWMLAKEAH